MEAELTMIKDGFNVKPLKTHPLKFIIDSLHNDDDPWPIEWMVFNVFNDYLQPDNRISVDKAAQRLDSLLPENRPAQLGEEKESVEDWMFELSDLIWKIAKQIPCDHEGQDKLIQLLKAVKRLPITQTIENYRGERLPAWAEFSDWHDSMRHALVYPKKRENPDQQTCDQYINASAFAARVHAAEVQSSLRSCAFVAIQTAIEGIIPDPELLPCHIIAGAQWIVLATEWLWSDIRWGKIDHHELRENGTKFLPYPPTRWVRWLNGFQKVATRDIDDDDVKSWADLAVQRMKETMRSHGYTEAMMLGWTGSPN